MRLSLYYYLNLTTILNQTPPVCEHLFKIQTVQALDNQYISILK